MNEPRLARPKLEGKGRVLYRCATCGDLMEPVTAVLVDGKSYHPDHAPEPEHGR